MSLKVGKHLPYNEHTFSVRAPIDDKFDVADRKLREALKQVAQIANDAVTLTAKKLLSFARLFNATDPSVALLTGGLTKFNRDKDHVSLHADLKAFITTNPIDQFTHGTPEHGLIYACYCLCDACLDLSNGDAEPAYRNTVRCRFALRFVGE